jgi:hypothetical protein
MAVTTYDGRWPHTKWIDLKNDGVMVECAVLKTDGFGNIYYIEIPALDGVDKDRIGRMLTSPRSNEIPLWEIMGNTQLRNGMNGLDYFHQLVKVITPEGVIMNPRVGAVGTGKVDTVVPQNQGDQYQFAKESVPQTNDARTPAEKRAETIAKRQAEAEANK